MVSIPSVLSGMNILLQENHSLSLSVVLHLVPGVLIVAAYVWIGLPVSEFIGFPPLFGFLIAGFLVLLPWELGLLLYLAKKLNGNSSLEGVVLFRNHLPRMRLFAIVLGLCVYALAIATGLSFVDDILLERFFSWVPDRFHLTGFNPTDHTVTLFTLVTVLNLFLFGIAAPFIEELYFRGFLLPRMSRLGKAAPIVNGVLFSIYHLWSPWQVITRILLVIPMVWFAWKKEAIEISIWTHCTLNCLGILLTYAVLMAAISG